MQIAYQNGALVLELPMPKINPAAWVDETKCRVIDDIARYGELQSSTSAIVASWWQCCYCCRWFSSFGHLQIDKPSIVTGSPSHGCCQNCAEEAQFQARADFERERMNEND